MDIKKFRELNAQTKVKLVNERLSQIKTVKEFKCKELEFSYASVVEEMERLGYERKRDGFVKTLTATDIDTLLELAKIYRPLIDSRYNLGTKVIESNNIKATTVKLDTEILANWQTFCKEHSDFSAPGLLGAALKHFMDLYK